MKTWEIEEIQVAIRLMLHSEYPAAVSQLYYILQIANSYGFFSLHTLSITCICALFQVFLIRLRAIPSPTMKFWVVFGMFETVQMLVMTMMYLGSPESFTIHLVQSTALLMVGEVSAIHSVWVNCALIAKHVILWVGIGRMRGIPGEGFSFVPSLWVFWNMLYVLPYKRGLLIAKQKAEDEKAVEEKRLKCLLAAMPDGVAVLSSALRILRYNPAMLTQLDLETSPHPEPHIETLVSSLQYDPEYCRPEDDSLFRDDILSLVRQKDGTVMNFKPVLYEGRHLECRGCVTVWDECKVLVLTVRDTSNWAFLEKTAKKDSANKTALIRSVSHELRTPVNSIINLCQDLLNSPTLSEKDREDVEVMNNASNFLISMINDLLDYSRILHDKFALVKTRFDLEYLIRSCGSLLSLQCRAKHLNFSVRFDPFLPKLAYTDENRLKQVILNLLSNAVK